MSTDLSVSLLLSLTVLLETFKPFCFPLAGTAVQPWGRTLLADLECGFIALMLTQMVYKGKFWTSSTCYCFLRCLGSQSMETDHLSSPNLKKYLKSSLGNRNVHRLGVKSGTLSHLNNPIWNGIGRSQHPLGHTDMLHYASEMHGCAWRLPESGRNSCKHAPDFDVICTAFHWVRNKTCGEEGELSIQAT